MVVHCAQCGSKLTPANTHRCNRCGLPFCRKHVGHHTCEPASRSDLAQWASSFEKGAEEPKGELPSGATYHPVSGVKLYSAELGGATLLWLAGLGSVLAGSLGALPAYADALVIGGVVLSTIASIILARTFAQMHHLPTLAAFMIVLVFTAIPILSAVALGYV